MSGPVFTVAGGPDDWYVRNVWDAGVGSVVAGPFFNRDFAQLERDRLAAPYPAEGVVFLAEAEHLAIAIGVSLLAAQQALDDHINAAGGVVHQVSSWDYLPASEHWTRTIMWSSEDQPTKLIRQSIGRVHVRKESK